MALWLSGSDGGICALCRIIAPPAPRTQIPGTERYWLTPHDTMKDDWRCVFRAEHDLTEHVLPRIIVRAAPDLQDLLLFRFARGTNYPITSAQWRAIVRLCLGDAGKLMAEED
jgi:hypothetical protein